MTMNESDLYTLKENYCNHIIDGMDMDCLVQMAHDLLMDAYKDCNEEELTEQDRIDLYEDYIGTFWEADDADDLVDEITNASGWCIKSIDYRIILK